tara:strand:+ start:119 stop:877 length:759 start_codon:yes stop_codon:yes gene_type:complete
MFIDSHSHIYYDKFEKDLPDVIYRAQDLGVEKIICVGVDLESSEKCIKLANQFSSVYATVGFHPHESKIAEKGYINILESMTSDIKVVGIGEMGLDFYYKHSNKDIQEKVFLEQLELANSVNLPAVVHSRSADIETINTIKKAKNTNGVIHCFASNLEQAKKILDLNYYISFTGLITFVNELHDVVKNIPLNKILIETDSPYLSPVPFRGKRNEPSYVIKIAEKISELKNIKIDQVSKITSNNTMQLFNRMK